MSLVSLGAQPGCHRQTGLFLIRALLPLKSVLELKDTGAGFFFGDKAMDGSAQRRAIGCFGGKQAEQGAGPGC